MLKKAFMIFGVLLLILVGCSTPELPEAEPVVFSVLYNERESTPFQEDWLILEEYEKRQNVLLDFRLGDDADFDREIVLTLESGNIPDIILKVWPNTIESYAADGILCHSPVNMSPLSTNENVILIQPFPFDE